MDETWTRCPVCDQEIYLSSERLEIHTIKWTLTKCRGSGLTAKVVLAMFEAINEEQKEKESQQSSRRP